MRMSPYLGVMTRAPGPELVAQAGLAEGFGLLVQEVMEDSPAAKGGLQQHDLLYRFEDQKLVNVEQLSALVRAAGTGSEVKLTVRRAGKDVELTVKVEEKLMPAERGHGGPPGFPDFRSFGRSGPEWSGDMRQRMDQFNDAMRKYQQELQEWMRNPKDNPQPKMPRFEGEPRDGTTRGGPPHGRGGRPESHFEKRDVERSVIRRDDKGEYALRSGSEGKEFVVRPKDGEERRFPISTEEQRRAVPAEYQARLDELEKMSRELPTRPDPEEHGKGSNSTTTPPGKQTI
jgi:hypothetical protein